MSLTLKIQIVRINQLKAMKFAPTMSVSEACATILEKVCNISSILSRVLLV